MKKLFFTLSLLSILVMVASSCTFGGKKHSTENITSIKKGETTRAQVEATLGEPQMIQIIDGKQTYIYNWSKAGLPKYGFFGPMASESQSVYVTFDENGVVELVQSMGGKQ